MKTSFLSLFTLLVVCGCQPAALTTPAGLKASTLSSNSISISWSAVPTATSYQLERKADSGNYAVIQASLKQPSHSDTGLSPSTRYSYRVKAMSARGSSAYAEIAAMTFASAPSPERLRVSSNKRYLETEDGKPFFYMAGVVWWMTQRITREEAKSYLQNRAAKGFNVVTISVVTEVDVQGPNPEGQTPLLPLDSNPNIRDPDKPNQKFFEFLDYIIDTANNWGIYIALNPAWNNALGGPNGIAPFAPMFTEAKARRFGQYLGQRYKNKGIIWVLGGDELLRPEHDTPRVRPEFNHLERRKMWRAMAEGLNAAMQETQLITFHPGGKEGSSAEVLDEPWLDFVMQQSGHDNRFYTSRIHEVYHRSPLRPVIDGEGIFEETAIAANVQLGYSTDADVRRIAYWNLLSGAAGHAYGHLSVVQFYSGMYEGVFKPLKTWDKALDTPGAQDMLHLKALMKSRPFYQGSPDIGVVARDYGQGVEQLQALRGPNFALIYLPKPRSIPIYMGRLTGDQGNQTLLAWWFNPRTGATSKIGEFSGAGEQSFVAPTTDGSSLGTDWVLVLDWKSAGFGPPGN